LGVLRVVRLLSRRGADAMTAIPYDTTISNPWEAEAERLRTMSGELKGLLFGVRNQDAFLDMPKYLRDAINKALDQP
jgi:hypothetical protein